MWAFPGTPWPIAWGSRVNIRTRPRGRGQAQPSHGSCCTHQARDAPPTVTQARPPLRPLGANTGKHQPPALMWGPGPGGSDTHYRGRGWQSRRKELQEGLLSSRPGNCTSPQNLRGPHTPVSDQTPHASLPGAGGPPDLRAARRGSPSSTSTSLCRWGIHTPPLSGDRVLL